MVNAMKYRRRIADGEKLMNRLNWNKNNIDTATVEIERLMRKAKAEEDDKLMLYGIIRAMLWAIGYILEWIERRTHDKD